jgi:hypothetical protein
MNLVYLSQSQNIKSIIDYLPYHVNITIFDDKDAVAVSSYTFTILRKLLLARLLLLLPLIAAVHG